MSNFLKSKQSYLEIRTALYEEIKKRYTDADKVFTPASPYGQIIDILSSFQENWLYFLDDIANELNIQLAQRQESIYALASLTGHTPTRTLAASGEIAIKFKAPQETIRGRFANFKDKMRLRCENNNLEYFLEIPNTTGDTKIDILTNNQYKFRITQGTYQTSTFVGNGEPLSSFTIPSKRIIDNDRIYVTVNGENWHKIESLYDMNKDSKHFIVKSNFDGGIYILFGNSHFGKIPPVGTKIEVSYVISEGFGGNINNSNQVTFKFIENTTTELDEDLDLNEICDIKISTAIILGSDEEDTNFTKNIAPYMSKSFVLANPNNYKHFLSRFDFLSNIEAWQLNDNLNEFYLFLIPKIMKYIDNPIDYFNIPISKFTLSADYENAILDYLVKSQRQFISTELKFVKGVITKYVINVFVRIFDDIPESIIVSNIHDAIANYFVNNTRRDRIPKSDVVSIIESVNGIDSVNISFVSERNEKAILNGFYSINGVRLDLAVNQNPNLGLDDFGDIVIERNEIPIIRGDFYDRNNNYFNSGLTKSGYGAINIFVRERIKRPI